jgi:oxygen-independent coproporphyrinogen-3 oxidase
VTETHTPLYRNRELLEKYNVPGPRYTSYPTAIEFSECFDADDYRRLWRGPAAPAAPLSLYVHIPFCENICYYCACNKIVTRRKQEARRYLDHLQQEISLQSQLIGRTRPVTQLHWGGGTPTYLSGAELTELMHLLASHFTLLDEADREYSIEIDPRTIDSGVLALLKGLGFNRLSFGVQDFDEQVQLAINRLQTPQQIGSLLDAARDYGFASISFDLIYGLPRQTITSLRRTLLQVIALAPDRIAFYSYAHLPQRFPTQRHIDRLAMPTVSKKLAMLMFANELLGAAGYRHIGMDHFVRPHDALARAQERGRLQRNFQGYSTCRAPDLVGLGVSAISSTPNGYAQNTKQLSDYYQRLERGELPVARGRRLHDDDRIRGYVIMEIICNLQLELRALSERFGITFTDYFGSEQAEQKQLSADGLIALDGERLQVTATGRLLLRNICMVFDRYLLRTPQSHYSRTV